jgi:anionic cell wall polymer biosynthesis LytR-Cps2A-Psr (LCP) family protein
MKKIGWILVVFFMMSLFAGCVTKYPIPGITVSAGTEDITPIGSGQSSFDVYTEVFQIENPTNRTFTNIDIQITVTPTTAFCHSQTRTITVPILSPLQKKTEDVSFSEFSGLDCQYMYTFDVSSETQQ